MHVLFVCTGNICRSPMAEALLRDRAAVDPALQHVTTASAGTFAQIGEGAMREAVLALHRRGVALEHHEAQQISRALVRAADLVFGMAPSHVEALRRSYPEAAERIHLLGAYVGTDEGVGDPFGFDPDVYEQCAERIELLIDRLLPRLRAA